MNSFKHLRDRKELPKLNKTEHEERGGGVLTLVIDGNVMINVPMKNCSSSGKSKVSSKVLASVQDRLDSSG